MCRVVLVILLFFLVALPLSPAQEGVSTTRKDDDNSEESFVAPIFANDPHVTALSRGQPVEGDLILGQQQLIGFSVPKRGGLGFPDVLLSLEIASVGGDADVFCLPLILTPANHFVVPGRANAVWRSAHTVGSDYVFISRNHSEFLRGVTAVNTTDGMTEYARLVCSVVGLAQLPTEYKVELDVDYESRALVQEELESMRRIREECCSELRSCGGWQHVERTITGSNVTDTSLPLDMCHVHGSLCDSEGHLVRLSMVAFDLRCEFPAKEIASFTRLEKLALSSNRLTGNIGEIAKELQALTRLEEFSAAVNGINGTINNENVCTLTRGSLEFLNLDFNKISGPLPACLFDKSSKLRELHLDSNKMSSTIPDAFPKDSELHHLSIVDADLTGGLPKSFQRLAKLRSLDLRFNNLSGDIPEEIGRSPSLVSFRMEVNKLTGRVPSSFALSSSIRILTLDNNSFTRFPDEWVDGGSQGNNLIEVGLGFNRLKGKFPLALAREPNLALIDLRNNELDGELSGGDGLFQKTWFINLRNNKFCCTIPEGWKDIGIFTGLALDGLRSPPLLDLSNNQLSGDIPEYMLNATDIPFQVVSSQAISLEGNNLNCPGVDASVLKHIRGIAEQCTVEMPSSTGTNETHSAQAP